MRVLLTGGGTGGHIYPALSVAEQLSADEVLYVGTAEGPEARIVPQAGVRFEAIPSRKLSRKPTPGTVIALAVSGWGVLKAMGLLLRFRPDVILGTGGYASAGVMFAAGLFRIPSVVHEANVIPGRVNRLLARLCSRIALTYEESEKYFPPGKCVVTGLPVRAELQHPDPAPAQKQYGLDPARPVMIVSGGSGGAQTLNKAVLAALPQLGDLNLQVVHATGRGNFDAFMKEVGTPPSWYHPVAYIDQMPSLMAAGTLILCRGGSSTFAEVTAAGLPFIAVPYPFAVADHQTHNAKALEAAGAGVMIPDKELDGPRLVTELTALLQNTDRLIAMREASKGQGKPDSAARVAELLRRVAGVAQPG